MPQFTLGSSIPGVTPPMVNLGGGDFDAGVSATPPPVTLPCGYSIALPRFKLGINLALLAQIVLGVPIPGFFFAFTITCDLSNPINVTAGLDLPFGGGRIPNAPLDPDLNDVSP
jgi:hypothetical protein